MNEENMIVEILKNLKEIKTRLELIEQRVQELEKESTHLGSQEHNTHSTTSRYAQELLRFKD